MAKHTVFIAVELESDELLSDKILSEDFIQLADVDPDGRPNYHEHILMILKDAREKGIDLNRISGKQFSEYTAHWKHYTTEDLLAFHAHFRLIAATLRVHPREYALVAQDIFRHVDRLHDVLQSRDEQILLRKA